MSEIEVCILIYLVIFIIFVQYTTYIFKELGWKRRRKGGSFQEDEYDNATSNLSNWLKRTQKLLDEPLEVEEQAALYEDIMSEIDSQKSQLDFASKFISNSESKNHFMNLIF